MSRHLFALVSLAAASIVFIFPSFAEEADENAKPSHYVTALLERGIEPTDEGLSEYLRQLHPSKEQQERAAGLIEQLGTPDSYAKREQAMSALLVMPTLPIELLTASMQGKDPEIRWRAKRVLEVGRPESRRVMFAAFRVIEEKKLGGTVGELIRALPLCDQRHLKSAARQALVVAARQKDAAALRSAMKSKNEEVRAAATAALAFSQKEKSESELEAMLSDKSSDVKLAAARGLADFGSRMSLAALISLLDDEETQIRVAAANVLRELTSQHFGFAAYDTADKRKQVVEKWRDWVETTGKTAKLTFPLKQRGPYVSYLGGNTLLAWGYNNRVTEIDPSGKEVWSYADNVQGAWSAEKLANGNVLIACNTQNRVIEVDGAGKIVWEHAITNALNAKLLDNGNLLVAQHGTGEAIEITRDKKIVWRHNPGGSCSDVHRLDNGNTLMASYGGPIVEVTPDGKTVWEYNNTQSYGIQPLLNGNVLIADFNGKVIEVTREKKIVWEFAEANPVHVFRLPNGNTLITGGTRFVEVTPDKKIVWEQAGCQYGSARR